MSRGAWWILALLLVVVAFVSQRLGGIWLLAFPVYLMVVYVLARVVYRRRSPSSGP